MIKVSVVILNWNGADMLRRFLPSVISCSQGEGIEVCVADNGSSDDSCRIVEGEFPSVRLIRLPENYGFAEGYNKALEQVGRKNWVTDIFSTDSRQEELEYTARTLQEISRAAIEMGKVKTGALIVLQREVALGEYERTGIPIDAKVSSQLLINIFEHNTPLHDGAVVIRGNRVTAATCYLPLSDNMDISKALGTRHRAAVGVSEATDSVTLVVSEETGRVSVAVSGRLKSVKDGDELRDILSVLVKRETESTGRFRIWKGRRRNERKADE